MRNYKFDNFRFILIFCVVLGHMLEAVPGVPFYYLYRLIYTFHMPLFLFITGYFAVFQAKRVIFHFVYPYVLFQTIYILFHRYYLQEGYLFQFTVPLRILWYSVVCIFCYLCIPLLEDFKMHSLTVIFFSFLISFAAGFFNDFGYNLSLGRFFSFFPFFAMGYYSSKIMSKPALRPPVRAGLITISGILLLPLVKYIILSNEITNSALYQSVSYEESGYNVKLKALFLLVALLWLIIFLLLVPNIKIPLISYLGRNTYPIFLLHDFFILDIKTRDLFAFSGKINFIVAVGLTSAILLITGNPLTNLLFQDILKLPEVIIKFLLFISDKIKDRIRILFGGQQDKGRH